MTDAAPSDILWVPPEKRLERSALFAFATKTAKLHGQAADDYAGLLCWSNDAPEDAFLALLAKTFEHAEGHAIEFDNPLQHRTATNGVYLARK